MEILLGTDEDGGTAVLTTKSPASHDGVPVLRIHAEHVSGDFGPSDMLGDLEHGPPMTAADVVAGWASKPERADEERAVAARFLRQWPEGPQVARGTMKTIWTLGHPGKRTQFSYKGSMSTEVTLIQSGQPTINAAFFRAALDTFRGRRVKGGFKEDDPPRGGFGEWVQNESKRLTGRTLTPRHGSFIAAILCSEGGVKSHLMGMAVWLEFPK